MTDCNPNSVPTTQNTLGTDAEGAPMDETWNYRAICGMLLYLSTNTRPDIAYAVSQVCRFGHSPKKSHATAVKMILRYLKGTMNKGTLVKPGSKRFSLEMCVDADFCGLFGQEDPKNPDSVRSRQGHVIKLCGWPIVWKSQLQSHLSQSTCESEHSALSSALKTFLPLHWILTEMIKMTKCKALKEATINSTVFEDNQSAFYLAALQKITSRTKCTLSKFHWFWEHSKEYTLVKCPTDKMDADYLTKGLPKPAFEANRLRVQGW